MICKLVCSIFLSVTAILFSGCSSENTQTSETKNEVPETQTIAVPQVEIVETPKFNELKKQFETTEKEVNRLEETRKRLLIVYTEEYPKVKKVSQELGKAKEKLKITESLLNSEREKLEYRKKNPPV